MAIAPTNLEDIARGRYEKPNYRRAVDAVVRWARSFGLATRVYDPFVDGPDPSGWHAVPRPNAIVDLDRGFPETVLLLAHYDVVPVPEEQRARWATPPHTLTLRPNGRLYGRGANDDLGSGVTGSLLALRRLVDADGLRRNVRLLVCCDEETGGEGGIEALRAHDARLAPGDPGRFLDADVALIPDGSPYLAAGSSGLAFLEASFDAHVTLSDTVAYGQALVRLNELASSWKSVCKSPDWPDHGAPEPVVTGRATVTRFDFEAAPPASLSGVEAVHAETAAGNQIPRAVTVVLRIAPEGARQLLAVLAPLLPPPFVLEPGGATSLVVPAGTSAFQVVGVAGHAGYPHRAHNPVPATLDLLEAAARQGAIDPSGLGVGRFTVDLRLPPEFELEAGLTPALDRIRAWSSTHLPAARIEAPPAHCRSGYVVAPDHPAVVRFDRIAKETLGSRGIFGEYGGTDASSLRGLTTPSGAPLPALAFGSMDPEANIHDVNESVDPRLLLGVVRTIERFVLEP